ncbi:MAG: sigma-70 family RNA polymerase sigma factor [Gemmatimonadales bacterium]
MKASNQVEKHAEGSFEREAVPHLDTLYRVAYRFTGEHARAEDLVQETMLKAFRAWHRFRPGTNARGWLLTILRNSFINDYRKQKREPVGVDIDLVDPMAIYRRVGQTDPEGLFFGKLIDQRVMDAIEALAGDFREVLVLSDVEDLSYAEISKILEIPIGTVKSRLFRARRQLQGQLYDHAVEMGYITPRERQVQ